MQWHLASPAAIFKVLSETYKVAVTEYVSSPVPVPVPEPEPPTAGPDTSGFKLASS